MLTKFAAALLATSLIAGSAIAAQPSGMPASNGAAPAVQTKTPPTPAANTVKPAKTVKHAARHRNHVRKHIARSKGHVEHHARHAKPAKTHQAGMTKSSKRS
ncbi:MAG: hypothetical protein ACLQF4_03910 [Xanthobacteraceae bacterium]|jgi:uncharacterized protein YdeI (BOF family)